MPTKKTHHTPVSKGGEVHAKGQAIPRDAETPKEETKVAPVHETPALPPCGPNQRYFEAPDGRILVGPKDASSIPDPLHDGAEINPKR